MAQPAADASAGHYTCNYFHHRGGDNYFNVVFHLRETPSSATRYFIPEMQSHEESESVPHRMIQKMSFRLAIYAFIVTVLLNLVQIKYQGKLESPFETRPRTMFLAIATLLLYHLLSYYIVNLRSTTRTRTPYWDAYFQYFRKTILRFCVPMSVASVTSLVLPESLSPLVFSLSVLFILSQILLLHCHVKNMAKKAAIFVMEKFHGQPPPQYNARRRGVQVRLPWLPQPTSNGVDIAMLPL